MNIRGKIIGGFAVLMAMSASSAAMAQCTGTGAAAALGPRFAPFAAGGAINTLISSINTANTAFLTQTTAFIGAPGNPVPNQEGGGVWARAIGGEITTKNTSTSTYALGGATTPRVPLSGSLSCDTTTQLQFAGTQVGTDMARLNWGGWNVHVGSMAGYLGAKASDKTGAGPLNPAGTLVNTLEVPFAGVYAAATYGGFFIDGQVRFDFFQNSINDPVANGLFNQRVDARGVAFTGNVGYNIPLQNNWFIEPSAGIVVSEVRVDPLNASGTYILANNAGVSLPNTTQINTITSTLGRLSLRGGTTIVTDKMVWQPFATASVYHEFGSTVKSTYTESPQFEALLPPIISGNLSTSTLGTYGQFGLGIAGQVVGTGWVGYLRGDYRTGNKIDGYSLNGGLRYQFTPDGVPMSPKGLITKAPMMAAAYNWTGFYIGGHFGALNGSTRWNFANGTTTNPRFAGALAGGQIGYDWQTGKWVFGVEGMMGWTNAKGGRACPNGLLFTCQTDQNWYGTATARVGYALWDRAIVYIKGGAAFAEEEASFRCNTDSQPLFRVALAGCPGGSTTSTKVGWTIGYGTEFALSRNWTVKGESSYFDLGRKAYAIPQPGGAAIPVDIRSHGFVSTIGLNYRFNTTGPLVAKY
jgi:opacity protein-like surface antigen